MRVLGAVGSLVFGVALCGGASSACGEQGARISAERVRRRPENDRSEITTDRRGVQVRPPAPPVASACEPGEMKSCGFGPPAPVGLPPRDILMSCRRGRDGQWAFHRADCATPLVVAFDDAAVRFTRAAGTFAVGPFERTEWVAPDTPWLALDADGSGCVEGQHELFGPPDEGAGSNGFHKLACLDENHDGRIDERDPAFRSLVLWADANEDRRCALSEITTVVDAGILAFMLDYVSPSDRPGGSHEGEHAAFWFRRRGEDGARRGSLIDVYLAPLE